MRDRNNNMYLNALSTWGVISRSLELLLENFFLFACIVLCSSTPAVIIQCVTSWNLTSDPPQVTNDDNVEMQLQQVFSYIQSSLLYFVISMVVTSLTVVAINGATAKVVANLYSGIEIHVLSLLIDVIKNSMGSMFVATCFSYVASMMGFLMLFLPGVFLWVSWSMVESAIVVEGKGIVGGLTRSWELSSGYRCEVWSASRISNVLAILGWILWNSLMGEIGSASTAVSWVVVIAPIFVVLPFHGIVKAVIYFNLRVQKENLTQSQLCAGLQGDDERANVMVYHAVPYDGDVGGIIHAVPCDKDDRASRDEVLAKVL